MWVFFLLSVTHFFLLVLPTYFLPCFLLALRLLLQYGANPSSLNNQLETPSHCAARAGNLATLKLLVEKGGLGGVLHCRRRQGSTRPPDSNGSSFDNRGSFVASVIGVGASGDGGSGGSGRSAFSARRQARKLQRQRRDALALDSSAGGAAATGFSAASRNLLSVACESEKPEVVEYLIEEIVRARRECFLQGASTATGEPPPPSPDGKLSQQVHNLLNGGGVSGGLSGGMDFREFVDCAEPRQAVFLELGADLAASNSAVTQEDMETSVYGRMLSKTPRAFLYLLDSCVYANANGGRDTFVDFFPFYNCEGKSELNILKVRRKNENRTTRQFPLPSSKRFSPSYPKTENVFAPIPSFLR